MSETTIEVSGELVSVGNITKEWVARNSGTTNNLFSVTSNGNILVATPLRDFGKQVYVSNDNGETWTQTNVPSPDNRFRNVIWDGNRFLTQDSYRIIYESSDGISWKQLSTTSVANPNLTYINNQYMIVGGSNRGEIQTSLDGVNWSSLSVVTPNSSGKNLLDVTWNGETYVAVGALGTIVTSTDGTNWVSQNSGTNLRISAVSWDGGQFVAVGGEANNGISLTSNDGVTWNLNSNN